MVKKVVLMSKGILETLFIIQYICLLIQCLADLAKKNVNNKKKYVVLYIIIIIMLFYHHYYLS